MPPSVRKRPARLQLKRLRARRLALAIVGALLGASCPFWPSDIVWVCAIISRTAEVLNGG